MKKDWLQHSSRIILEDMKNVLTELLQAIEQLILQASPYVPEELQDIFERKIG